MITATEDVISERLESLAREMTETAILMFWRWPKKADELMGAAGLVEEWREGIDEAR